MRSGLLKQLVPLLKSEPYRGATGYLISVSGGMDSMVLLDAMRCLQHVHHVPLRVAHIHHGTGAFADQALQLVAGYCRGHALPLLQEYFPTSYRGNFEQEAAKFRRAFLRRNLASGEYALLGHHAGDQAETALQSLVRGIGLASPLGMLSRRAWLLRPLLCFPRKLLAEHARLAKVPHLLDPSNYDCSLFRNAVRHLVLPRLNDFHHGFETRFSEFLQEYEQQQGQLLAHAEILFQAGFKNGILDRTVFTRAPRFLWPYVLHWFWERNGLSKPCRRDNLKIQGWLEKGETGSISLPSLDFYCDLDGLLLLQPTEQSPLTVRVGEPFRWYDWQLTLNWRTDSEAAFHMQDAAIHVRLQKGLTKSEREFLRLNRIPIRIRQRLPCFWVDGHPIGMLVLMMNKNHSLIIIQDSGPKLVQ